MKNFFITSFVFLILSLILGVLTMEREEIIFDMTGAVKRRFKKNDELNLQHFMDWCFVRGIFKATIKDFNKYIDEGVK